jgi:hypothetical protein
MNERIKKMWHMCAMAHLSSKKKNEIILSAGKCV